jgi:hypothetical protein
MCKTGSKLHTPRLIKSVNISPAYFKDNYCVSNSVVQWLITIRTIGLYVMDSIIGLVGLNSNAFQYFLSKIVLAIIKCHKANL